MYRLGSSYRARSIDDTLQIARAFGRTLGVSRVTDTTRLDRVGLPVFAAIRPDAVPGSLCVSAGKGMTREEAEAGAWMEAIELALAEPRRARLASRLVPSREVLGGEIETLCPVHSVRIAGDDPIAAVEAEDLSSGERTWLPAELVVFPFDQMAFGGRACFGSDGNGISSGNSLDEATLHGLHEVIERDVSSFHNAGRPSQLVRHASLPPELASIIGQLHARGFEVIVRALPNDFAIPVFLVALCETNVMEGVHFGYGCHLDRRIALVRAVTEAAQSRLTCIHGGRDDLHGVLQERSRLSAEERTTFYARALRKVRRQDAGEVDYGEVPDRLAAASDLSSALRFVLELLREHGFARALRVRFTDDRAPVQALRIVVPRMEMYAHGVTRMGPRIRRFRENVDPGADANRELAR